MKNPKLLLSYFVFFTVFGAFFYYKEVYSKQENKKDPSFEEEVIINESNTIPVPFLLKNGKKILVDSATLKPITGIQYDELTLFKDGLARVEKNGKWGFINKEETVVIPYKYHYAFDFSDGIAEVTIHTDKSYRGFINKKGEVVIPLKFQVIRDFGDVNRMFIGGIRDNSSIKYTWYLINKIDYQIISLADYEFHDNPRDGLVAVKKNGKWGFIDKNGNKKIQFIYDDAYPFSEGLARVKLNDNWFIIDINGEEIFDGVTKYIDFDFHEGLIAVERDGKWGFVDKQGNEIIEFKYSSVSNFKNGFASVELNNAWGLIDKNDNVVIPFLYSKVGEYVDGLVMVISKELKYGFIDLKGNVIIEIKYDGAENFKNGFARVFKDVKTSKGTEIRYGLINKKGEVIIPLEYNELYVSKQFVQLEVYSENTSFYSDLSGNLLREK